MSLRDRILGVYRGQTPDVVPFMLDLAHWFMHKNQLPWDLSDSSQELQHGLIDYHKKAGVGFYYLNKVSFFDVRYSDDVQTTMEKSSDGREITWKYQTPLGAISRTRVWEPSSYSWAIRDWGVKNEQDLRILGYVQGSRTFSSGWDCYKSWLDYVGDVGVLYIPVGLSGMGYLLCYWMGIENTMYAVADYPGVVHQVVDQINAGCLRCVDLLAQSPAEVIVMGDNFSSAIQPPHFFDEWSRPFYQEAVRRLHAAGKCVAVHIDGMLKNALGMIEEPGADCADAVTPAPMRDLWPEQCREEAGPDFILSGGVSPDLWLPRVDVEDFKKAVIRWLKLKKSSPRLIAAAGDQVPPGADEDRIQIMGELVDQYGKY